MKSSNTASRSSRLTRPSNISRPVAHGPEGSNVTYAQCAICAHVILDVDDEAPSHFLRILVGFVGLFIVIVLLVLLLAFVVAVVVEAAGASVVVEVAAAAAADPLPPKRRSRRRADASSGGYFIIDEAAAAAAVVMADGGELALESVIVIVFIVEWSSRLEMSGSC